MMNVQNDVQNVPKVTGKIIMILLMSSYAFNLRVPLLNINTTRSIDVKTFRLK